MAPIKTTPATNTQATPTAGQKSAATRAANAAAAQPKATLSILGNIEQLLAPVEAAGLSVLEQAALTALAGLMNKLIAKLPGQQPPATS